MSTVSKRKKAYQKSFKKHGTTHKALQWLSEEARDTRYQNITSDIDFEGKSILDIGCGFGDLVKNISKKAEKFEYTGIDIVPEFINEAKKRYSEHEFKVGNYHESLEEKDIIICSGALNSKLIGKHKSRFNEISLLWENSREVLVFNMAGSHPQPENSPKSKIFYADSLKILEFCLSLTRFVILRHHYRKKDFTVIMFRQKNKATHRG